METTLINNAFSRVGLFYYLFYFNMCGVFKAATNQPAILVKLLNSLKKEKEGFVFEAFPRTALT